MQAYPRVTRSLLPLAHRLLPGDDPGGDGRHQRLLAPGLYVLERMGLRLAGQRVMIGEVPYRRSSPTA